MPATEKKKDWKIILNSIFESFSLKCPSCNKGRIFSSYLKITQKKKCDNCGLDFSGFDVGDGPAYVAVFIICFAAPLFAILLEVIYKPSLVVHAITSTAFIFLLTYIILIYSRSSFIHLEYKIRKLEKENEENKL